MKHLTTIWQKTYVLHCDYMTILVVYRMVLSY